MLLFCFDLICVFRLFPVVSLLSHRTSCVVDCSAASADSIIPLLLTQLERGGGVALANKKPFTGEWKQYQDVHTIAYRARVKNESTGNNKQSQGHGGRVTGHGSRGLVELKLLRASMQHYAREARIIISE